MNLGDIIVLVLIALILGGAVAYIIKAKKSGKKCIGCPDSCSCNAKKQADAGSCPGCGGSCHCHENET